jgi:hypothetical protein
VQHPQEDMTRDAGPTSRKFTATYTATVEVPDDAVGEDGSIIKMPIRALQQALAGAAPYADSSEQHISYKANEGHAHHRHKTMLPIKIRFVGSETDRESVF